MHNIDAASSVRDAGITRSEEPHRCWNIDPCAVLVAGRKYLIYRINKEKTVHKLQL